MSPPTLHDTFEEGEGATLGFLGATQKGYGPEKWGIKLEQIEHLYNNHPYSKANPGLSMRDFVNKVIILITKGKGVGYALLVNQKKPLQAKVMVSHSWEEPVEHFIECIGRSDVKEEALWICALSIHQSNDEADGPTIDQQLGPNPEFGPFVTVLRCAVLMIAVITDACDIYTRLWCDYEMHTALMLKVKVKLCPHAPYDNLGDDVCIKNLTKRVNSEKAFCSWEPDRKSIHDAIMSQSPNGFEDINTSVEKIRLQYFLEYPADKITATNEESKREAFERYLVSSIETLVCRIYTMAVNKLPHFQYFHENKSGELSDLTLAFREWKESVEKLISEQEERSSQKD